MSKTIALIGALDTKGADFAFVKAEIERRSHRPLVINTGVVGEPSFTPDIEAAAVAEAAGTTLDALRQAADRGNAIASMANGIAPLVRDLYARGEIDAVLAMGGSAGTVIGTAAMRALPLGVPKVMVSTLASGDTAAYVGTKDILMLPSVVDVAGVNRISAKIYANAVGAITGMVETEHAMIKAKPLVAASMFGNTTALVDRCRQLFDERGYEVMVFHATGTAAAPWKT